MKFLCKFVPSYHISGSAPKAGLASGVASAVKNVPEPDLILDLQFAAAASSYAPGTVFESLPKILPQKLGLSMSYFSPADPLPATKKWLFGDGGSYENIPLINFLQRKVEKIVLFFNSETALQPASKWDVEHDAPDASQISDTFSGFFGVLPPYKDYELRAFRLEKNQVFAKEDYAGVIKGLQAAQDKGHGIVHTATLTTVANAWWGIPAGFSAQVTFVYLGRLRAWESLLSPELKALLVPGDAEAEADLSSDVSSGPFRKFPHYATTGGAVNSERANVLADLTGWSVLENAELFKSIFA